ncbi:hypothetical protein CBLAS_1039 [Campylobacter blaseri]|uniref:Uncharacterized protein n=1 Tax=Campylobacter blaseri TaxID=2042961 RepID=A0A2P8QYI3_9BACT|nr:hypothetical protein [Campylobacter blaseri]PSM51309.1 hypothetical protein CQ405_08750 [Campylobacter blaseri]PSM52453.1 hypothetical protein CRN67_08755 [Campylobacter blaseri]QKF86217.1 hypothetical protein CBLAS_1039 [Campylobacter blaseri]
MLDWDNFDPFTMIEPEWVEINWQIFRDCLAPQTYKEIRHATSNPLLMEELNGEQGEVTNYRLAILMRWCRALQLAGFEDDIKSLTSMELLTAMQWQEELEISKAFWTLTAKQMRDMGNTDLEILKALNIDLYEMYFKVRREWNIPDEDRPAKSPYNLEYLREKVLIA